MCGASLAGRDATDHLGPDTYRVPGVKGGVLPGEALEDDF